MSELLWSSVLALAVLALSLVVSISRECRRLLERHDKAVAKLA